MTELFGTYLKALLTGTAVDLLSANIRWCLVKVTDGHTFDIGEDGDEFLSDIAAGNRLAFSPNLGSKTVIDAVFDAADTTLTDPGGGETGHALVLLHDTGTPATSRLILVSDEVTGLPITLDGTDDDILHNASGIFAL